MEKNRPPMTIIIETWPACGTQCRSALPERTVRSGRPRTQLPCVACSRLTGEHHPAHEGRAQGVPNDWQGAQADHQAVKSAGDDHPLPALEPAQRGGDNLLGRLPEKGRQARWIEPRILRRVVELGAGETRTENLDTDAHRPQFGLEPLGV